MRLLDEHKRGATFSRTGTVTEEDGSPVNLSGAVLACKLRDATGALIDTLVCTITDAPQGEYTITRAYADTALWPIETLRFDVEYTFNDGTRDKTQTVELVVVENIT